MGKQNNWIYISDLYGGQPKVSFSKVELGFAEFYSLYSDEVIVRRGKCDRDVSLSPMYKELMTTIREYVIKQKYQVPPNYKFDHEALSTEEYPVVFEELWGSCSDLYYFADEYLRKVFHAGGIPSLEQRYFYLFASGAYLRARLDFNMFGKETIRNIAEHQSNFFTLGDLAVLSSKRPRQVEAIINKHIEAMKEYEPEKDRNIFFPVNLHPNQKISSTHYPINVDLPEVGYYSFPKKNEKQIVSGWNKNQTKKILSELLSYKTTKLYRQ